MTRTPTTFNVLSEPCLPVEDLGGGFRLVSVRQALAQSQEIRGLDLDALSYLAVMRRLLLPLVFDALRLPALPDDWEARFRRGAFDANQLDAYFEQHAGRFNLFDSEVPFDQTGRLEATSGETKPVTLLVAAVATGNNVPLFSARTEADVPALSPSEALVALLRAQCYDTAAIKPGAAGDDQVKGGKTSGNPTGPVGQFGAVVPRGRTLFETIMLNTPLGRLRNEDRPWWRRPPATPVWRQRYADGVLDLLTFQSRRIRLIPEESDEGIRVRRIVLSAGDRLAETPEFEPHAQWRRVPKPKAGEPHQRPMRHQSDRAGWQGLQSLLALTWTQAPNGAVESSNLIRQYWAELIEFLPEDLPLDILIVGVEYGNMSAVVENVIEDHVPLPVRALAQDPTMRDEILDVVRQADQLRAALNRLDADIRQAAGGDPIPWDKGQRPGDQLLHTFDLPIRSLLAALQERPDELWALTEQWRHTAFRLTMSAAEPILMSAPPSAFLGRLYESKGKVYRDNPTVAERKFRRAVLELLRPDDLAKEMTAS